MLRDMQKYNNGLSHGKWWMLFLAAIHRILSRVYLKNGQTDARTDERSCRSINRNYCITSRSNLNDDDDDDDDDDDYYYVGLPAKIKAISPKRQLQHQKTMHAKMM